MAIRCNGSWGHGVAIEQRSTRLDQRRWRASVLGVLMAIPALLVLAANRLGPGISPDSVNYASAARSLAQSGQLITYEGRPLTIFPPGLPVILGTAERLGIDLQATSIALNVVCVAAGVLLSYLLAARSLASRGWAVVVAAVVSVSWSTISIYSMLWTEPLFTTLTLLVLLVLARALQRRTISWWEILLIGTAVSLATTIRFVGFTLLPAVTLGVFFAVRSRGWVRAAGMALITGGLSSIGLIFVTVRNIELGIAALGERSPSEISLLRVLKDTAVTLGLYGYPSTIPSAWLTVGVGMLLAALLVYGLIRALILNASAVILLGGFTGVYWLSLWYSQFATTIDAINPRLTVPVFTPMLVIAAFATRDIWSRLAESRGLSLGSGARRILAIGVIGLLLLSLSLNAFRSARTAYFAAATGIGFNSEASLSSPLATALTGLPQGGIAATNSWLAYWTSGRSPITQIPRQDHYWPPEKSAADLATLKMAVDTGQITFLAFFDQDLTALAPDALEDAGIPLTFVRSYEDGSLYEVHRE